MSLDGGSSLTHLSQTDRPAPDKLSLTGCVTGPDLRDTDSGGLTGHPARDYGSDGALP
jgi:hypothetical protein